MRATSAMRFILLGALGFGIGVTIAATTTFVLAGRAVVGAAPALVPKVSRDAGGSENHTAKPCAE
jgi:hypothetical protein